MDYAIAIDFLRDSDPILGQLIDRIGACQLHQYELEGDLFFCLSRSILHQQLSTKVAKVIHQRFLQLYPDTQFPLAQDVLDTPDEVLRGVGISRPKISYLKDLARHAIAPTAHSLHPECAITRSVAPRAIAIGKNQDVEISSAIISSDMNCLKSKISTNTNFSLLE